MDTVTLQLAQLVAYSMLTLSSVVVASVSLTFGYRQNFGWKPIALITSHGLTGGNVNGYYGATLDIELWNRRKYPIIVRHIEVNSTILEFEGNLKGWNYSEGWHVNRRQQLIYGKETSLEPSGKAALSFEVPFKKRSLDELIDPFAIRIDYFDPRLTKTKTIKLEYTYHMGALDNSVA